MCKVFYVGALSLLFIVIVFFALGVVNVQAPSGSVIIPSPSEWTDRGTAISPGSGWDKRLSGMLSPVGMVKKNSIYYLYYIGADGNRSTDGGPRNRKLGVATSQNGIDFTKYSGNPVLTYQPHNNPEEGVFSGGVTLASDGTFVLYYGGMRAPNSTSESVDGQIRLAESSNGFLFTDRGEIVSPNNSSVWGHGDEIFPSGVFTTNHQWHVYYTAKGSGIDWGLGLASGRSRTSLPNTQATGGGLHSTNGGSPIFLDRHKLAVFVLFRNDHRIEVRTTTVSSPQNLSSLARTYHFGELEDHFTIALDKEADTWFMYYYNNNSIKVKTAPVRYERGAWPFLHKTLKRYLPQGGGDIP